jgi:DNA-binding MarR family transcriptional regulator
VGESRREKVVTLTTSAEALFSEWAQIVKAHHQAVLRGIRGDERDDLYRILSGILANVEAAGNVAPPQRGA